MINKYGVRDGILPHKYLSPECVTQIPISQGWNYSPRLNHLNSRLNRKENEGREEKEKGRGAILKETRKEGETKKRVNHKSKE